MVIPCLVGLLKFSATISNFSLKVIQTLGGTTPSVFKEVADALPGSYRKLLENAANVQKQKEVQNAKVVSKRAQRARPAKELTMDFSQYD